MTQEQIAVRSFSPAYWFVCDTRIAKREKSSGRISEPFATKAEAERRRAAIAKAQAAQAA